MSLLKKKLLTQNVNKRSWAITSDLVLTAAIWVSLKQPEIRGFTVVNISPTSLLESFNSSENNFPSISLGLTEWYVYAHWQAKKYS